MSYGLPVFASDIPANLVVQNAGFEFYPPGDVLQLAAQLRKQATAVRDAKTVAAIKQHVVESYHWNNIARATLNVYSQVLTYEKALPHKA
jgi:glycosyltransferase involved in cell wall biosynthesis